MKFYLNKEEKIAELANAIKNNDIRRQLDLRFEIVFKVGALDWVAISNEAVKRAHHEN